MQRPAPLALALVVLVFGTFAGALGHGFLGFDDPVYVTENRRVLEGLSLRGVGWAFGSFEGSTWLPLSWLSHMLDVSLFGTDPAGHHATSVLLHALNSALAFLVLRRLGGRTGPALAAAALWALHPLRVESVAWIASRKDLVSGLGFLLTLWCWQAWVERPSVRRYLLVALVFGLGLAAKQSLVTLPCVLLLLDVWPLQRRPDVPWSRLLREKLPLFALAGIAAVLAVASQSSGVESSSTHLSLGTRLTTSVLAYAAYVRQTLLPFELCAHYPLDLAPLVTTLAAAGLLLIGISSASFVLRRRAPALGVGWLWFLGMLVPMLGIVRFGIREAHADRYTYLPQLGLWFGLVFGVYQLAAEHRARLRFATGFAVALAAAFSLGSVRQTRLWRSDAALWEHALAVVDSATARYNLAEERRRADDPAAAIAHLTRANQLTPDDGHVLKRLGALLAQTQRGMEAEPLLGRAADLLPDDFEAQVNYGTLLIQLGRGQDAIPRFERALSLEPGQHLVRRQLAALLGAAGRPLDGAELLRAALANADAPPEILLDLGRLYGAAGDWPQAIQALRSAPESIEALSLLEQAQERAGRARAAAQTRARLAELRR